MATNPTTPVFMWTADHPAWLAEYLDRLNWSYRDLDEALGYGKSRGSYTTQVIKGQIVPGPEYRRRLQRWLSRNPQPKFEADLLQRIQAVAVPWLRARQGQPMQRTYSRGNGRSKL